MQSTYTTARLILNLLTINDSEFISELVNSEGWLQFIGDRNVRSIEQAEEYVRKIMSNADIKYWVVKTKETGIPAGIITFIKRDGLDFPDIGFAFLRRYSKKGYAKEATEAVLHDVKKEHPHILAITMKENIPSIRLLERLGFRFDKEIEKDEEALQAYIYSSAK